jgi:serine/threonine-protein kinase
MMSAVSSLVPEAPRSLGRYLMAGPIAVGGMASVHFGRLEGPEGFRKPVAIKRMLASSDDVEARTMLLDEARVASRIHHANVVQTLDVIEAGRELFIVLEFVNGASFDQLLQRARAGGAQPSPRLIGAVLAGALRGLHAAHEATADDGASLELVHRDFSPQNVLVGADGVSRVLDFGVARARGRMQGTRDGQLKGKLAYLSPEQVHGEASRQSDVFAAGIVLWEALSGRRLFDAASEAEVLSKVLLCRVPPLDDEVAAWQPIIDRALEREPTARFATALEMATAIEALGVANPTEVAAWVQGLVKDVLDSHTTSVDALQRLTAAPVVPAPSATPSRRAWLVAPVLVLLLTGAGALYVVSRSPAPAPTTLPPPPVDVKPAEPKPVEPAPAEPVVAPPAVPVPAPTKAARPPTRVSPTADACNPPFTIDANGVKQFKVECLK